MDFLRERIYQQILYATPPRVGLHTQATPPRVGLHTQATPLEWGCIPRQPLKNGKNVILPIRSQGCMGFPRDFPQVIPRKTHTTPLLVNKNIPFFPSQRGKE